MNHCIQVTETRKGRRLQATRLLLLLPEGPGIRKCYAVLMNAVKSLDTQLSKRCSYYTHSSLQNSCWQANQRVVLRFIHMGVNPVQ